MKYKRDNKKKDRGKKRTKPKKRYIHRRRSSSFKPHKRQKILSKGIGKAGAQGRIGRSRAPHRHRLKQRLIDIATKQKEIWEEVKSIRILQKRDGEWGGTTDRYQRWEDLEEQRLGQLRSVPFDERRAYYIDQDLKRRGDRKGRTTELDSEWKKKSRNQSDTLAEMHRKGYYKWAINPEDIKDIISG